MFQRSRRRALRISAILACLLGTLAMSRARAALPPIIPRQVLFGNPERSEPRISPDGRRLTYLKPDANNVMQIWIRTLGREDDRELTHVLARGIQHYEWTWNDHTLFYLRDRDGDENDHVWLLDAESGESRDLTPWDGVKASVLDQDPALPNRLLLLMNRRDPTLFEPWKYELDSGALTEVAENPGDVRAWLADGGLEVRGRMMARGDGGGEFQVRDSTSGPWRTVITWNPSDRFEPFGFTRNGNTVFAVTDIGAATAGIYTLSLDAGGLALLADYPGADPDQLIFVRKEHDIQAASFNRLRPTWRTFDVSFAHDWDALARLGPGDVAFINRDLADLHWVLAYRTADRGDRYYLWTRGQIGTALLFDQTPGLARYQLAAVTPRELRSRDGLSLPCYLTLPVGVEPGHLPLVLYVHDGPWDRDRWRFDPTVQWLANRGYAVLQVNYRGSVGFGKGFREAGRGEYGRKMQDDLVDAVNWAVKEGIADRKKIGIMGVGYGGYAALVGLSFTPGLFACGVDLNGPADLEATLRGLPAYCRTELPATWSTVFGNPDRQSDLQEMRSRSPAGLVSRIKAPLLIAQGANNPLVRKEQVEQLVQALRAHAAKVEYLEFSDEGRELVRPENRIALAAAAEAFLARHLGGRQEAAAP